MKPGMFVIVSEWLDEIGKNFDEQPKGMMFGPPPPSWRKPVGDPLKVLALALPYATFEFTPNKGRGVIDTRTAEFIKVDRAYVRSLLPHYFDVPKSEAIPSGREVFVATSTGLEKRMLKDE